MRTIETILAEQRAVIATAEAEGRAYTDDEAAKYEALEAELKSVQRTEEIRARQAAYEAPNASLTAAVNVGTVKSDDTLDRAFTAYLRTGQANQDITELRAQTEGSPSGGGYTVPTTYLNRLTEVRKSFGGIQAVAETLNTDAGEPYRWASFDDTANTGELVAEGAAPTTSGADLTFGEVTLGAFRYTAPGAGNTPLEISQELLQDSQFDFGARIIDALGKRIERTLAVDLATGAGTTEPRGILNGTALTNKTVSYDHFIDAIYSVDPSYWDGAVWILNPLTVAAIEKLKDGANRPLINQSVDGINVARTSRTLLGFPVVVCPEVPAYAATGAVKWGVFGNVSEGYIVRRVNGVIVTVDPYTAANNAKVKYSMHVRADGNIKTPAPFRVLQGPAS
ncbi:phage major capsid protein [Mycobacterium sp. EPG1]|nr:phage major capsid protein [Mycobacterium sp. EPG1]